MDLHALTAHKALLLIASQDRSWISLPMKGGLQHSALPHVELLFLNLDLELAIPELLALLLKLLL